MISVIVVYCWLKLNQQSQDKLQGTYMTLFGIVCELYPSIIYTVVYEEPYALAVSKTPQQQTEPEMEQCPAYGMLSKQ